jgi:DNA-binding NarL/FixJ family response regulator
MIRVAIAAGSDIVRAGLEALLRDEPGLELTGFLEGLPAVPAWTGADVVLAALDDTESIEEALAPAGREIPIVLLADSGDTEVAAGALRAGARAVLPPDASKDEILGAIHAVSAGLAAVRFQDLELLLRAPAPEEPVPRQAGGGMLSPRELEILRMIAEGMANKTIAWKLGISEHTVKFHVAAIMNRLGAASRTEAVALGIRRGLIML